MTEPRFAHALVIGGTGMLRHAASWLAERAMTTTMIARDAHRLARFREAHLAGCVHTASLDYHDDDLLRSAIAEATHRSGPIDMALAWIHGTASRAPRTVAQHCGTVERPADLYLVLPQGALLDEPRRERVACLAAMGNIRLHRVILGSVTDLSGGTRWLSHDEISRGAVAAMRSGDPVHVVGEVPGEQR